MRISNFGRVLPRGPHQAITISQEERDALFERILLRLTGIDALQLAAEATDWEKTAPLGREFGDLLIFVSTDLGWGPSDREEYELRTTPDVLARAVGAVERVVHNDQEIFGIDLQQAQAAVGEAHSLLGTCQRIKRALAQTS